VLNANDVSSKEKFTSLVIFRDNTTPVYPLSSAQERLWFIEQYSGGSNAYHLPIVLELGEHTDIGGIKYALQQVVARHEVLRTTLEQPDGQPHSIQVVHEG